MLHHIHQRISYLLAILFSDPTQMMRICEDGEMSRVVTRSSVL